MVKKLDITKENIKETKIKKQIQAIEEKLKVEKDM